VLDAWGECAEALGQYREAVHAIEQALTLGGSEVTRHLSAARLLRSAGSYARVMPHLRAVLWLQPSAEHYLVTAETLRRLGRAEEARGVAHESTPEITDLSVDSVTDAARDALLRMWVDPLSAVEAGFDELLRVRARHPEALVRRGTFHMLLGRYPEAAADFEEALAGDATCGSALVALGQLALCEGDAERCVQRLRQGPLGDARNDARALSGEALRRLGRVPQATRILTECTQQEPERASSWINLALCLADGGDAEALAQGVLRVRRCAPGLLTDAARAIELAPEAVEDPAEAARVLESCLAVMRGSREVRAGMYRSREGRWRSLVWRHDAPEDGVQREPLKRARELLSWGARGAQGSIGTVSLRP
jgi:tetratricopeptide (TPR) repeat protein